MSKIAVLVGVMAALAAAGVAVVGPSPLASSGPDVHVQVVARCGSRGAEAEGRRQREGRVCGDGDRERVGAPPEVEAHISRGSPARRSAPTSTRARRASRAPCSIPFCGPCTSGKTGQAKISKDAADLFERDRVYVNVHTTKNAAGEIRGQLKLVGESESTAAGTSPQPGTTTAPIGSSGGSGDPGDGGGARAAEEPSPGGTGLASARRREAPPPGSGQRDFRNRDDA